jgi:hypothetical protein
MATENIVADVKKDFDGTTIGNVLMFTTEQNKGRLFPMEIWFSLHEVSGLVSAPALSIGTVAINYNDIVPVTRVTNLNTTEEVFKINLGDNAKSIPKDTPVYLRISEEASATTYLGRVHFIGHYFKD